MLLETEDRQVYRTGSFSCRRPSARQLYRTETLRSPVRPAATAVVKTAITGPTCMRRMATQCLVSGVFVSSYTQAICKLADRASFAPPSMAGTKIGALWRQKDVIMDQFREELMTPDCQLIGECTSNLLRPIATVLCGISLALWGSEFQAQCSVGSLNFPRFVQVRPR